MRRLLGSGLQLFGVLLGLLCVGTLVYANVYPRWAEGQYAEPSAELAATLPLPEQSSIPALSPATDAPLPTAESAAGRLALAGDSATDTPSVAADPLADAAAASPAPMDGTLEDDSLSAEDADSDELLAVPPGYGRALRMEIPRIRVNSRILDVSAQWGEYEVPGWDVGHHADSVSAGAPGNSVFNGHLETINAGRVFARLKELRAGDAVYVFTETHRLAWVVKDVRTVPDTDFSFIQPTDDTRITLYTCAGRYNPLTGGYTHWLVLVGELVDVAPLS
jgi:LPXTG-site transpeptidase (sortase) family protein